MDAVIFKALGNITRLKIIEMLMIKEHNVSDLTKISKKDQTTVSRHLANLKEAKIISQKRIGRNKIYAIKDSKMKAWLNVAIQNNNKPEENTPLRDKVIIWANEKSFQGSFMIFATCFAISNSIILSTFVFFAELFGGEYDNFLIGVCIILSYPFQIGFKRLPELV